MNFPDFPGAEDLVFYEKSGLAGDSLNTWIGLAMIVSMYHDGTIQEAELLDELLIPVQTYKEYYAEARPKYVDQIMAFAKPEFVKRFDHQVISFNSLPIGQKKKTLDSYMENCSKIIEGEI